MSRMVQEQKWSKSRNGPRAEMVQEQKWSKSRNGPRAEMVQEQKWAKRKETEKFNPNLHKIFGFLKIWSPT